MNKGFIIFGGFNPPTNAHVNIGKLLLKKYPDSLILYQFAPVEYFTQWKKMDAAQILPTEIRIQLLKDAIPQADNFDVQQQPWLHAIDNMTSLKLSAGLFYDLHIVVGADKLCELHTWYKGQELIKDNKFLVITRNNENGQLADEVKQFADHFEYLKGNNASQTISSTQIRDAYLNGDLDSVKKMIPKNVYKYLIETPGLFGQDRTSL